MSSLVRFLQVFEKIYIIRNKSNAYTQTLTGPYCTQGRKMLRLRTDENRHKAMEFYLICSCHNRTLFRPEMLHYCTAVLHCEYQANFQQRTGQVMRKFQQDSPSQFFVASILLGWARTAAAALWKLDEKGNAVRQLIFLNKMTRKGRKSVRV